MKKKRLIGTLLASTFALTAAFTGCSLVTSNNDEDMLQVIATVNIANAKGLSSADKDLIDTYKGAVGTTKIYKNELIAYYLNRGISYVNMGYSTSYVFNMLVDGLVENAVLTQYATMYLLDVKVGDKGAETTTLINEYKLMSDIEKLEYLLTDDGADDPDKEVKIAKYGFYSAINSALDSYEQKYLDEEDTTSGSENRATPSGIDTEKEDFYPAKQGENGKLELDYNVYTGYKGYLLEQSGDYKENALKNTERATRQQAYNEFLRVFIENGLIDPDKDNLIDIKGGIEYMNHEYISQLESRIINKYYDLYEKEQEKELTGNDYLDKAYNKLMDLQKENADDSFKSDIGSISDTSFVLYAPDTEGEGTYGFVYNILLPFNASQSAKLTALQNNADNKDDADNYTYNYYKERNELLKQIKTTDQRQAWFNSATSYAFDASEKKDLEYFGKEDGRNWLFFENNLTKTDRYESLDKYIGKYPYNGEVVKMPDGSYKFHHTKKLTIDDMLAEFKAYIEYVLNGDGSVTFDGYNPEDGNEAYYNDFTEDKFYTEDTKDEVKAKDKKIDYENFIYAEGSVSLNGVDAKSADYRANIFNKDSAQYKALAAVNELQYAYTTDTGVLSQYLGYTVTLGDTTGYIKEFETAAHVAIEKGPGSFNVCAGDYGWHLIYVTFTYPNDEAVYQPNWDNITVEGTFENFFYEWLKNNDIKEISTTRRTEIMTQFNVDSTVNKITSAYQDLLDLDSNS